MNINAYLALLPQLDIELVVCDQEYVVNPILFRHGYIAPSWDEVDGFGHAELRVLSSIFTRRNIPGVSIDRNVDAL